MAKRIKKGRGSYLKPKKHKAKKCKVRGCDRAILKRNKSNLCNYHYEGKRKH